MRGALIGLIVLLLSGCSSPPADVDEAPVMPEEAPSTTTLAVTQDGTLALGNCVDGPPLGTACVFNIGDPLGNNLAGNIVHVPIQGATGTLEGATATLTWTSSSPLTDELELRFSVLDGCPQSCSTHHVVDMVTGASPLTLTIPALTVEPGYVLGVTVSRAEIMGGNRASTWQDFEVSAEAYYAGPMDLEKEMEPAGNVTVDPHAGHGHGGNGTYYRAR